MDNKLLREIVNFYKNEDLSQVTGYTEDGFKSRVGDDLFNKITIKINDYFKNILLNTRNIDTNKLNLDSFQELVYKNINDQLNKIADSNIALEKIDSIVNKSLITATEQLKTKFQTQISNI